MILNNCIMNLNLKNDYYLLFIRSIIDIYVKPTTHIHKYFFIQYSIINRIYKLTTIALEWMLFQYICRMIIVRA